MRQFKVDLQTYATATITVELSDERLASIAVDMEKAVNELTLEDLREYVEETAYTQGVPGICAQCSGWGRDYDLDLAGDWDVSDGEDAINEVTKVDRRPKS